MKKIILFSYSVLCFLLSQSLFAKKKDPIQLRKTIFELTYLKEPTSDFKKTLDLLEADLGSKTLVPLYDQMILQKKPLEFLKYKLLKAISFAGVDDMKPAQTQNFLRGQKVFQENCASCHMSSKDGKGPLIKDKKDIKVFSFQEIPSDIYFSPLTVFNSLTIESTKNRMMPSFRSLLSIDELWDVSFYVQSLTLQCDGIFPEKISLPLLEQVMISNRLFESDDFLNENKIPKKTLKFYRCGI